MSAIWTKYFPVAHFWVQSSWQLSTESNDCNIFAVDLRVILVRSGPLQDVDRHQLHPISAKRAADYFSYLCQILFLLRFCRHTRAPMARVVQQMLMIVRSTCVHVYCNGFEKCVMDFPLYLRLTSETQS